MYVITHPPEYCAGKASEEAPRAVHDSVEYGLRVGGRAADHAQHLGRGRLLLEGLREISIALSQLREQAHVLDRDDRLVRKGLQEGDLCIREGPDLHAPDQNRAESDTFAEQWSRERRAMGELTLEGFSGRVLGVRF